MFFRGSAVLPLAVYGLLSLVGGSPLHAQYQSDSVLADFNNDKHVDLAFPNFANAILRLGNGDGTFQSAITIPVAAQGVVCSWIAAADFNGDGNMDLAVGCGYGLWQVIIVNGNGDGTFGQPTSYQLADEPTMMAVGDLNKDGHPDLVIMAGGGGPKVYVFLHQDDGTFKISYFTFQVTSIDAVTLGDWNGDGILDLALARGNGDVRTYLGRGDGTFQFEKEYPIKEPHAQGMFLAVADFHGDGKQDLLISEENYYPANHRINLYAILFGDGDGTFQAAQVFPSPKKGLAYGIVAADFNGDGKSDFAIANLHDSQISVFLGNGDGTFRPPVDYPAYAATNLLLANLNGDGKPDIYLPGSLISMINNGDGTFKLVKAYTP